MLAKNTNDDLRVYTVWFSMYEGDQRDRWPREALTDPRVTHFWDEQKSIGRWYAQRLEEMKPLLAPKSRGVSGPVLWDAYLVYGPDSKWEDAPSGLRRWGRTVLAAKEQLKESVDAFGGAGASQ